MSNCFHLNNILTIKHCKLCKTEIKNTEFGLIVTFQSNYNTNQTECLCELIFGPKKTQMKKHINLNEIRLCANLLECANIIA